MTARQLGDRPALGIVRAEAPIRGRAGDALGDVHYRLAKGRPLATIAADLRAIATQIEEAAAELAQRWPPI